MKNISNRIRETFSNTFNNLLDNYEKGGRAKYE